MTTNFSTFSSLPWIAMEWQYSANTPLSPPSLSSSLKISMFWTRNWSREDLWQQPLRWNTNISCLARPGNLVISPVLGWEDHQRGEAGGESDCCRSPPDQLVRRGGNQMSGHQSQSVIDFSSPVPPQFYQREPGGTSFGLCRQLL